MIPIVVSIVAISTLITLWVRSRKGRLPYPPGPPAEPLLGHLRALPKSYDEGAYREMANKYGGIIYLDVLGKSIVILNSEKIANELLDKRSAIYSDRPSLPFHEMTGLSNTLTLLPYGNNFLKTRKLLQDQLTRKKCTLFNDIQLAQRSILLQNLLLTPENFGFHTKRFVTAVVLEIAYGRKVVADDDPFLVNAEVLDKLIAETGTAGLVILDFLPFLKYLPPWVPGAWYSKFAQRARPIIEAVKDYGIAVVQHDVASGKAQASFSSLHLEELDSEKRNSKEELDRLKWTAFTLYSAGAETTWSALETFFLAMVLHPDAQREIDQVIGHGQLPGFEDQDNLPYLNSVVQEVVRWCPVIPLGMPHRVMQDDVYEGMLIPKGSMVLGNLRVMLTNEEVYHDPFTFVPERFLPKPDGHGEPPPNVAFGFGRRVCPGRWLAQSELWIAIASILSMFDIKPIQNDKGEDILPLPEFHNSITSHPKPFQCRVLPRSYKTKTVIEQL